MLDSIFIGMTGLSSYSKDLKVISNNVTNLNTPGFKSSQLQFGDMFYQDQGAPRDETLRLGNGVNSLATSLNFKAGEYRQTGNDLDLAIKGKGFFILKNDDGSYSYTKAGQFSFNDEGVLVTRSGGKPVMSIDENGSVTQITMAGMRSSDPKATTLVTLTDNLSLNDTTFNIDGVSVFDAAGNEHVIKLTFNNNNATSPGSWKVTVKEKDATLGTYDIKFNAGKPVPGLDSFVVNISPAGVPPLSFTVKLGQDAKSTGGVGETSRIKVDTKDGYGAGSVTKITFDEAGSLVVAYSNGQTSKTRKLAVASFDTLEGLQAVGGNEFVNNNSRALRIGKAGKELGDVASGTIEISNVDLSQEFSDLIIAQRGYQASSQLVSTANEMIKELFDMRGR
ncbi:flagellar basal-body rod protein FlgF [Parachitinimonas caeni]|uniref:Flagellar basal-body rod protein FlgF n=1 Tax=Parachitinimonas caeni TaxID=3031301 RepID=A0ABT7DYI4_9NEIS|nr:flagellar basal-body rod protein FlgF [Parachitinimonas caeni]MDK2125130.1 flagellar basal-body rod protein FlgF [Parachitinimonas caeni]